MSASALLNRKRPRRNRPTQAFYYYLSEVGKTMQVTNCTQLKAFIDQHKTKEPESLEAAIESIK